MESMLTATQNDTNIKINLFLPFVFTSTLNIQSTLSIKDSSMFHSILRTGNTLGIICIQVNIPHSFLVGTYPSFERGCILLRLLSGLLTKTDLVPDFRSSSFSALFEMMNFYFSM